MRTSATNRRLRVLISALNDRTLQPRPDFQRRLVWSTKHKLAFVKTVLEGFPFPEIYIAAGSVDLDTSKSHELLVDGQQRLDTLFQYFNGSETLKLTRDIVPYKMLTSEKKSAFLDYEVVVRDLGDIPIEEVKQIFQRINSTNYALNPMEVHNSQFSGELISLSEKLAELPFWEAHNIFSTNEIRRMLDMRFVLTSVITMMSTYFNRNSEIEDYIERYNDDFPMSDKVSQEFKDTLNYIESLQLNNGLRVWKQADIFTILVELHRFIFKMNHTFNSGELSNRLNAFYEKVSHPENHKEYPLDGLAFSRSDLYSYQKASIQATNDRGSRITRGEILLKVLLNNPR